MVGELGGKGGTGRVGTRIKLTLESYGISPHSGCGCIALANEMDTHSVYDISDNLDVWALKLYNSIVQWRSGGLRRLIPQPPMTIVRELLKYAIKKEIDEIRTRLSLALSLEGSRVCERCARRHLRRLFWHLILIELSDKDTSA